MVLEDVIIVYMIFEDGTVWKIQRPRDIQHWYRSNWRTSGSDGNFEFFNRPQELGKFQEYIWTGTLYGTDEIVWWAQNPHRRRHAVYSDGCVYSSKTKETRRFVRVIEDHRRYIPIDTKFFRYHEVGVLFDKELDYLVQCVKHFMEHKCYSRPTAKRWWKSTSNKLVGGFICRKIGSNSSKDFYLVGTEEAEHRFEFKDFHGSQRCDETKKRKQKKQMLAQKRRKKAKLVSKARRRARDQKYLHCY